MKPNDALAFLLYAAAIGFCASVGRTAWRVDAMSVVVALAALALLLTATRSIARSWITPPKVTGSPMPKCSSGNWKS